MSLADALRDKMKLPGVGEGPIEVEAEGVSAEVDLVDADRLGAQVDRVRVRVDAAAPLQEQAERISDGLRGLGERLHPVEIDDRLGGGVLRTRPDEMRGRRYYEVGLDGNSATVERYKARRGGGRDREPFTVTNEQLERLVEDLAEGLQPEGAGQT